MKQSKAEEKFFAPIMKTIDSAIREAVLAERERCAHLALVYGSPEAATAIQGKRVQRKRRGK